MYGKKLSRKNMLLFSKGGMMMMIDDRQTDKQVDRYKQQIPLKTS